MGAAPLINVSWSEDRDKHQLNLRTQMSAAPDGANATEVEAMRWPISRTQMSAAPLKVWT